MTANMVKCPLCGELHEAVAVDGLIDTTIIPCPFQPRDKAVLVGDALHPRRVVIIDIGEEVGSNLCDLSH